MKMVQNLYRHKLKSDKMRMRERVSKHQKEMDRIGVIKSRKQKQVKKDIYRALGKLQKKNEKYKKDWDFQCFIVGLYMYQLLSAFNGSESICGKDRIALISDSTFKLLIIRLWH